LSIHVHRRARTAGNQSRTHLRGVAHICQPDLTPFGLRHGRPPRRHTWRRLIHRPPSAPHLTADRRSPQRFEPTREALRAARHATGRKMRGSVRRRRRSWIRPPERRYTSYRDGTRSDSALTRLTQECTGVPVWGQGGVGWFWRWLVVDRGGGLVACPGLGEGSDLGLVGFGVGWL